MSSTAASDPSRATSPDGDGSADGEGSADGDGDGDWPAVSVVMPVLDEERHLAEAVRRIVEQRYPGELEVVLALGPSHDRTDEVARALAAADPRVRLVRNPGGRTPDALNLAIGVSRHEVVVRVDGHGHLPADYIRRAVALLERTAADNVGGMMVPVGETPFEQAVARAMSSRLGMGGAPFHVGGDAGPADTVYLGVFRRSVLERLGGFDTRFARAQDWELNYRIRRAGGTVWFSPDLRVTYRPRSSVSALARQFYRTGRWRRQVQMTYPDSRSLRYLAPPTAVAALATGSGLGVVGLLTGARWALVGLAAPAGYLALLGVGTVVAGRGLAPSARLRLPVAVAVMHLCWGAGYLRGPEEPLGSRGQGPRPGAGIDGAPDDQAGGRAGGEPGPR